MPRINYGLIKNATQLEAALHYAELGLPVFPCHLDKSPLTRAGFKDATTDLEQVRTWWNKNPDASIGMPTGSASCVFAFDVDLPNGPKDFDKLESTFGRLPATTTQRTGSGGKHLLFKMPQEIALKNRVHIDGTQIDVRGEGGYIILPPSPHPSGNHYNWDDTSPVAEAPSWLFDWIMGKESLTAKPEALPSNQESLPYTETVLDREIAAVRLAPEGERNDTLNKAAFHLGRLIGGGALERHAVEEQLACATTLPEKEALRTIQSGLNAGVVNPWYAPKSGTMSKGTTATDVDTFAFARGEVQFIPFDDTTSPPITPEMVPGPLSKFCSELAEAVQVPFELALCGALGAVSTVSQRKFKVRVTPGYHEPVNMYLLCALPPGERKSAAIEKCKRPLLDWQKEQRQAREDELLELSATREVLEKTIVGLQKKAANADTKAKRDEFLAKILERQRELPEVPAFPRLLADDFTPEALAVIMEKQEQRIGLMEAEGGIFETLAGRYNRGIPNIDMVLKCWSSEGVSIDRKGKEPIFLHDPALTLCIAPQPDVVQGLASKQGFKGRGLLGRFWYFMPKSRLGFRTINPPQLSEEMKSAYEQMLKNLLALPWDREDGENVPFILQLDPVAQASHEDFMRAVERQFRPNGELEFMADWGGKLAGGAVRLAALLHLTQHRYPQIVDIDEGTMRAAHNIASVIVEHAKAAFSLMGTNQSHEDAKAIIKYIKNNHLEVITGRDCLRKIKGHFKKMTEDVNPALEVLEERLYLHAKDRQSNGKGRPPGTRYFVNPRLLGG